MNSITIRGSPKTAMQYISTRQKSPAVPWSEALARGLAPDGGLYVPESLPQIDVDALRPLAKLPTEEALPQLAEAILRPLFEGDILLPLLPDICKEAFRHPLVLRELEPHTGLLELFHGPTAAFKDWAAGFLAACWGALDKVQKPDNIRTVVVATSGDTGGAVAAALHNQPGTRVVVLFPWEGVSSVQLAQLTGLGGNVHAFAVRGSFDDCQAMAKAALGDEALVTRHGLTSANSINIARMLPQAVYAAWAALVWEDRHGSPANFMVPTGNLGDATAAWMAKAMGFPIGKLGLACNANRAILDWLESGKKDGNPTIKTLANAMDVGIPSNLERLSHWLDTPAKQQADLLADSADDAAIRQAMHAWAQREPSEIVCPHTAAGLWARARQSADDYWVVYATAHAAKFPELIQAELHRAPPRCPQVERANAASRSLTLIQPTPKALVDELTRLETPSIGG